MIKRDDESRRTGTTLEAIMNTATVYSALAIRILRGRLASDTAQGFRT